MTDRSSDTSAFRKQEKQSLHSSSNIPADEGFQDLKRKLMDALQNPDSSIEGDAKAAINWLTNTVASKQQGSNHPKNPFNLGDVWTERENNSKSYDLDAFWPQKEDSSPLQHEMDFDDTLASKEEAWESIDLSSAPELTPIQLSPSQDFPAKENSFQNKEPSAFYGKDYAQSVGSVMFDKASSGGRMADLSAYKDLSKAPMSFGDDDLSLPSSTASTSDSGYGGFTQVQHNMTPTQHFVQEVSAQEVDTEFSGNVKTLIRLVNELPEGVTKQTGAQIIRLTMEAMGISMENVLSEAQSAQSEMLDAVRANIKKIEEYKTVIRKLETDIKYYQGKANELSEIIDLFILSNTSGQKVPFPDDLSH